MDRKESVELYEKGVGAWNRWAKNMLRDRPYDEKNKNTVEQNLWENQAKADFQEMTFRDADFVGFVFPWIADFSKTTFENAADFSQAEFEGAAEFSRTAFENNVSFYRTRFYKKAKFFGVSFQSSLDFRESIINDDLVFKHAIFGADAGFSEVKISGNTWFDSSVFERVADFDSADFRGNVSFSSAKFQGPASFANTILEKRVNFEASAFQSSLDFKESIINSDLVFDHAIFRTDAGFTGAKISGNTWFDSSVFEGVADFDSADFRGNVSFSGAKFQGPAWLADAIFEKRADFEESEFLDEADFGAVQGKSAFLLADARFVSKMPNFVQATFAEAPRLDNVWIRPRRRQHIFRTIKSFFKGDLDDGAHWRALKRIALQGHDHVREQIFFGRELLARRWVTDKPWQLPYWFGIGYQLTSNFGRSLSLPLMWWALVAVVATITYAVSYPDAETLLYGAAVPSACSIADPWEVWLAAAALSLQRGLPVPASLGTATQEFQQCLAEIWPYWMWFLGVGQFFVSASMIFLFLYGMRNRFRMK